MTIKEIIKALKCYVGIHEHGSAKCFGCRQKDFCDDITHVIKNHKAKTKRQAKTIAEKLPI